MKAETVARMPPHAYFVGSAVFHYLGPSFAVLLFALAHRVSRNAALDRLDGLGAAMLVAAVVITPIGGAGAARAFLDPVAIAAGVGVGLASSVIPYVCDQLAMARLRRATYSLMVSLLPATATVIGIIVLAQIPTLVELIGVALIVAAVAVHRDRTAEERAALCGSRLPLARRAQRRSTSATSRRPPR